MDTLDRVMRTAPSALMIAAAGHAQGVHSRPLVARGRSCSRSYYMYTPPQAGPPLWLPLPVGKLYMM